MPSRSHAVQRSSGLHQLWGALLGAAMSNTGANPDYATEQAKIDALNAQQSDAPKITTNTKQPVIPKSVFAKSAANQQNAQVAIEQANRSQEAAQKLQTEKDLSPILLERLKNEGKITNEQKLAAERTLSQIKLEQTKAEGDAKLVQERGLPSANLADYQKTVAPGILSKNKTKHKLKRLNNLMLITLLN
jgi:hypothetical protein